MIADLGNLVRYGGGLFIINVMIFFNIQSIRSCVLMMPVFSNSPRAIQFHDVNLLNLRHLELAMFRGIQEDIEEALINLEGSMFI